MSPRAKSAHAPLSLPMLDAVAEQFRALGEPAQRWRKHTVSIGA